MQRESQEDKKWDRSNIWRDKSWECFNADESIKPQTWEAQQTSHRINTKHTTCRQFHRKSAENQRQIIKSKKWGKDIFKESTIIILHLRWQCSKTLNPPPTDTPNLHLHTEQRRLERKWGLTAQLLQKQTNKNRAAQKRVRKVPR